MWGLGQHSLLGIVVGLMWGLGQDTLLGIVDGLCGTSGNTLYWVSLLVYVHFKSLLLAPMFGEDCDMTQNLQILPRQPAVV
jgi:hypothetical protein